MYGHESGYGFNCQLFSVSILLILIVVYVLTDWGSTIVGSLGFSKNITLLLTAPPYILATIVFYIISYISDVGISNPFDYDRSKQTNNEANPAHKHDFTGPSIQSRPRSSRLRYFDVYTETRWSIFRNDADALRHCRSPDLLIQDIEHSHGPPLSQACSWCGHD